MKATCRSRGAALLAALLTVACVATLAAAGLWQQWRTLEVETAERQRAQSLWVLLGALDWARMILREDARAGTTVDHLAEPWALPLQEARLSTFLAVDRDNTPADAAGDNAFLSGEIVDLQSRLNLQNLLESGRISPPALRAFERLFDVLGLAPSQLDTLVANLRLASAAGRGAGAYPADLQTDTDTHRIPLMPVRASQLGWLGLSPATVTALEPYVTVLPARTPVNLNTASAQVIYAALAGIGLADARRLVAARAGQALNSPADAARLLGQALPSDALVGVNSRFFEVRGQLRLNQATVQVRTLVERDRQNVKPLQHLRGSGETAAPSGTRESR